MVSVSGKLTMKPVCQLLRSHRVSLSTVESPVGAFFIQRVSVDNAADAGNCAVGPCRLPVFSRGLFVVPSGSCAFAFLNRLAVVASAAARPAASRCCDGRRMRFFITAAAFGRRMLRSRHAWFAASTGSCIVSSPLLSSARVDNWKLAGLYGESRGFFSTHPDIRPPRSLACRVPHHATLETELGG